MKQDFEIVPDVLTTDPLELEAKVSLVKDKFDVLHVDIIDGLYADNLTLSVDDIRKVDMQGMQIEIHAMVDDPYEYIHECSEIGCYRMVAQIEKMGSQLNFVREVSENGMKPGLGIDLYTPVEALEEEVIESVETVLIMSVKAGNSGQEFQKQAIEKIKSLRKIYDGRILVDGGVRDSNVRSIVEASASAAAVNSFMWDGDIENNIRRLYEESKKTQIIR